jgi:hypothetical protein
VATPSTFAERYLYARDFQRGEGRWTTDGELAAELGLVSQSEITTYKKRESSPPAKNVLVIAKRTGVDPGWLAFGADTAAPEPPGFAKWIANRAAKSAAGQPIEATDAELPTRSGAPRLEQRQQVPPGSLLTTGGKVTRSHRGKRK